MEPCNSTAASLQNFVFTSRNATVGAPRWRMASNTSLCVQASVSTNGIPTELIQACLRYPGFSFCDQSKSFAARAASLVSMLTVEEKVAQMSTYNFVPGPLKHTPGIPRLGIAPTQWHSEGLHGLRLGGGVVAANASLFPQVTGMAATRNVTAFKAMARVMAVEARALNWLQVRTGELPGKGGGLSYWGPTQNIIRDPRWGRSQESVSESPLLNG